MKNLSKTQIVPGNPQRGQVHPVCMWGWIIFSNNWIEPGLLNKQTTEVDVSAAFALLKQAADNHVALDAQLSYTWAYTIER